MHSDIHPMHFKGFGAERVKPMAIAMITAVIITVAAAVVPGRYTLLDPLAMAASCTHVRDTSVTALWALDVDKPGKRAVWPLLPGKRSHRQNLLPLTGTSAGQPE